jgi:DNA polymerase-2
MTADGPEPVQKRSTAGYDYGHYSNKQLAPIADTVLRFFDLDYRSLITGGRQLNLF